MKWLHLNFSMASKPLMRPPIWPWVLLAVLAVPAVWHILVFPKDVDSEFPGVDRPTYNAYPPPAYRLAEPGDTIDRIQIYISSLAIVLAVAGWVRSSNRRPWLTALSLAVAAFWWAANPGPTFDHWHGLGWRSLFDARTPVLLRIGLAAFAITLLAIALAGLGDTQRFKDLWNVAKQTRTRSLWIASGVLVVAGLLRITDVEPFGYWPRWEIVWGLAAFCAALVVGQLPIERRPLPFLGMALAGTAVWFAFVSSGIWLTWYHRPLSRLREIVPGKIMISAMPTERGLEIAQERHHFKTIINLFPEDGRLRSPKWPAEMRFVKKHGLSYFGSTSDPADADRFLDLTLKAAQDPDAWPILIHCHGCMDRTPAWVGIYQFVVENKPLLESLQFIEQHRGYRPKASVSLLYNRVLERLAPERRRQDPTASALESLANGYTLDRLSVPESQANKSKGDRVVH